jgi:hypothetical protein
MISNDQVSRWGLITNLILLVTGSLQFLHDLATSAYSSKLPLAFTLAPGTARLYTLLFVGVLAAVAGGILWSGMEKALKWNVGAGGSNDGLSAAAASMAMTLPLVLVPAVYQYFTKTPLILHRHFIAGAVVVVANALGWLLIFGWKMVGFQGIQEIIEPLPSDRNLWRRLKMELVFTCVNFCSVVLIYRVIVDSQFGALNMAVVKNVLVPATVYFSGMSVFTIVRYPDSIENETWVQIRGVLGGLLLTVTLAGGMLM